MLALSIKQPWAWLICNGYKDIENRNWRIGRKSQHGPYKSQTANFQLDLPCRIYVHAGKEPAGDCLITSGETYANLIKMPLENFTFGAIIGEVDIVDCVTESK